jgi:DNA-binding NarL/FixJ family response regulator
MPESRFSTEPPIIRTLIVTDVSLFREGLARLLAGHADVQIVGSATANDDVQTLVATTRPDIILIDATTVRASELVPRVTDSTTGPRVVAFAIAAEDEDEVLACAEVGVAGYVARSASVEELVAVLRSAALGEVCCPPHVTATLFRQVARLAPFRAVTMQGPSLTRREDEVVALMEEGLTNKEIARRIGIEVTTVKNHVHNILDKLRVRRRGDVASFLRSQGRLHRPRPQGAI